MSSYVGFCHFSGQKKLRREWQMKLPYPLEASNFGKRRTRQCDKVIENIGAN